MSPFTKFQVAHKVDQAFTTAKSNQFSATFVKGNIPCIAKKVAFPLNIELDFVKGNIPLKYQGVPLNCKKTHSAIHGAKLMLSSLVLAVPRTSY